MKKSIIILMVLSLLIISCKQKKVEDNGTFREVKSAATDEVVKKTKEEEKPKEVKNDEIKGRVDFNNLVGKYKGLNSNYLEIKQEGNDYFARFGIPSKNEFNEKFKKDKTLSYINIDVLSGEYTISVFPKWFKLELITIEVNNDPTTEFLLIQGLGNDTQEIYLYPSGTGKFEIWSNVGEVKKGHVEYIKGNVNDNPNMNKLMYNIVKDFKNFNIF